MSSALKLARVKTGLSQEEAAGKLGVHPTTLNKYESGARFPSGKVLQKMSQLYEINLQSLIETTLITNPVEDDQTMKEKLAVVEKELLALYRENRMLKEELATLQKKEGTNN